MPDNLVSKGKAITTTSATDCYTVPTTIPYASLRSVSLCNYSAASVVATLAWYDLSGTTTYRLQAGTVIPAGTTSFFQWDDGMQLDRGDIIRVTVDTASAVDVVVTVIESTGRST